MGYVTITVTVHSKERMTEGLKLTKRGIIWKYGQGISIGKLLLISGEMNHHGPENALKEVEMAIHAALPYS
ncbi:MAG: hypothetical protein V8R27_04525 [Oscillospiraceae bacterium]